MKNMEIINDLRKDFAEMKGLLLHLQKMRRFSVEQSMAIEAAVSTFSFMQTWYLCNLRKQFGDRNCYKLEKTDQPPPNVNYSMNTHKLFEEITESAQNIQRKLLNVPADNGCDDIQSAELDNLHDCLRWWRDVEITKMIGTFQ